MKISEFRKLIREEVRKVISEGTVNPGEQYLTDSALTPDDFVILGMGTDTKFLNPLIQALGTQKIKSCTVKSASLNAGEYRGYKVVMTLANGDTYKLFFDKNDDELSQEALATIKNLQPGPGKALAAIIREKSEDGIY